VTPYLDIANREIPRFHRDRVDGFTCRACGGEAWWDYDKQEPVCIAECDDAVTLCEVCAEIPCQCQVSPGGQA